jgi:hypothetical protein
MAGYSAGRLELKKKKAEQRAKDYAADMRKKARAIKRTGLGTPSSEIEEIWNFMMFGGGEITANVQYSMFRDGWLPYLRANKGTTRII